MGKRKAERGKVDAIRLKVKGENLCQRAKRKACFSVSQRQRGRALFATTGALAPQRSATKSPQSQVSSAQSAVKAES